MTSETGSDSPARSEGPASCNGATRELTELDRQILEFAAHAPRTAGAREEAIRANFDISPVRFHQRLNQLLETRAALENYPVVVKRSRRVREHRDDIRRAARASEGIGS